MKKTLLIALVVLLSLPTILQAHAPKKLKVDYNSETGILKIEAPHSVKKVESHYIDEIVVTINEVESKKTFTSQSSKASHVVELEFPNLEKGTVISIYASCNKMGSRKAEIIVE